MAVTIGRLRPFQIGRHEDRSRTGLPDAKGSVGIPSGPLLPLPRGPRPHRPQHERGADWTRGVLRTLRRRAVKRSIGGWHVIFDQRLFGHRVHRAYVTVHMNRDRQVYLVKSRAVPNDVEETLQPDRHELGLKACRELAVRSLSHTTGPRR